MLLLGDSFSGTGASDARSPPVCSDGNFLFFFNGRGISIPSLRLIVLLNVVALVKTKFKSSFASSISSYHLPSFPGVSPFSVA